MLSPEMTLAARIRELENEIEFIRALPQLEGLAIWQDDAGKWRSTPVPGLGHPQDQH